MTREQHDAAKQAVDKLAIMLASNCRKGFFGRVSVEAIINDGSVDTVLAQTSENTKFKH